MKVTITDKDALGALSWEALRTYLDSSDWQYTEDIPGKAAVYQHTDDTGRVWEILAPLRRNLADYVSRMGDAVTILARIEDRSELDVYEDLRVLGAQAPQVDDDTRTVHDQIRRWLAEERWDVRDVNDPQAIFNVMATLRGQNAPNVNIFQYKDHFDHVTLSQHWVHPHKLRSAIEQLPDENLNGIIWSIYRDVSMMGVDFSGLDTPTTEMTFRVYLYFDGLTKNSLIQGILLTLRAVGLAVRTVVRALELQNRSEEHVHSPEKRVYTRDELKEMMKVLPRPDDPLTITG